MSYSRKLQLKCCVQLTLTNNLLSSFDFVLNLPLRHTRQLIHYTFSHLNHQQISKKMKQAATTRHSPLKPFCLQDKFSFRRRSRSSWTQPWCRSYSHGTWSRCSHFGKELTCSFWLLECFRYCTSE